MEGLLKVPPMIRTPSGASSETYNDKYVIKYNFGEIGESSVALSLSSGPLLTLRRLGHGDS
jgi:hypothetical protein